MVAEEIVHSEAQGAKPMKRAVKKTSKKREVILAPDLYAAVLESMEQAKEGKVLSHEEVTRRNEL